MLMRRYCTLAEQKRHRQLGRTQPSNAERTVEDGTVPLASKGQGKPSSRRPVPAVPPTRANRHRWISMGFEQVDRPVLGCV